MGSGNSGVSIKTDDDKGHSAYDTEKTAVKESSRVDSPSVSRIFDQSHKKEREK